MHLDYDYITPN